MKDKIEDIDFSFGKYSSTSLHKEYEDFLHFHEHIESLPADLKRSKGITGRNRNFENISELFTSFCSNKGKGSALFRKGTSADELLVSTWLSFVYEKERIISSVSEIPTYTKLKKEYLSEFAKYSVDEDFPLSAPKLLLSLGIILIYQEAIPSAKVDGVVYVNEYGNPVIALSLRYSRLDNYWFTLLHELSHVVLHYEQLEAPIIEDLDINDPDNLVESQADRLALDSLIPRNLWRGCVVKESLKDDDLFAFAKEIGIHPAIIAGRVRNERKAYKHFSKIINAVNFRELVFNV
ncbi:ImmA/IrrE family metallo-endopeptidase [Klebsiella variicola subsp. variicola]|uniref:ImmA/IrrE family metallo-endopeptidase n=1 Tax=Klebsiella variicola TaxID=244366 RepID=UPI00277C9F46|nr:ImmA/IrrE family metallo-endopeptidase [Klebsiella variicola]HDS5366312.1 ImmA/IrrE family metallo-endopeptidase [Klebsiella variicola]